jgi:hypothetical protein
VFSGYKCLREDSEVVIYGSGETNTAMFSENLDAIIHPTIRLECDIVATLIEIITPVVICLLKENIPHFG